MLNNCLKFLQSESRKFSKKNNVFDIVLYGSSVRDKEDPNDIDILLIFVNEKFESRLKLVQEFKDKIKNKLKNLDIKSINLEELFDKNFLAGQGVLIEGISLVHLKPISKSFGFKGYSLFTYSLKNLNNSKKTSFTYSLLGRNKEGILKQTNALQLGKGAIAIPIEKSAIFEDFLKNWKIDYKERKILISE